MPHHAKNSDYIAAADPACEDREKREAKERFDEVCLDIGIPDQPAIKCTRPFNPTANVFARRAERRD